MIRGVRISAACIAVIVSSGCAHVQANASPETLFGVRGGIDHATALVRDLAAVTTTFGDRLGFTVTTYRYPNGFENRVLYFADGTYLELYPFPDSAQMLTSSEAYMREAPEGLLWNSPVVDDIYHTVTLLRSLGRRVAAPQSHGGSAGQAWSFRTAGLDDPVPGGRLVFIQYNDSVFSRRDSASQARRKQRTTHSNGAMRMHSVWVATRDLASTADAYADLRLPPGRRVKLPILGAVGREILAGRGTFLLLEPVEDRGAVASFLGRRSDAYMGISIRVSDITATATLLRSRSGLPLEEYRGVYGRSIVIPASHAHGVWIDLFQ